MIYYIGGVKSTFFYDKLVKMNILPYDATKRSDFSCVEGWTNSLRQLDINVDVVFFGDSHIRYGSFQKYFPDERICNLGYGGDRIREMIMRVSQIKAVSPRKVFVMGGINDLLWVSDDYFKDNYQELIDSIVNELPHVEIYMCSILPVNPSIDVAMKFKGYEEKIVKWNDIIQSIEGNNVHYVDVYNKFSIQGILPKELTRDGLHLNEKGYKIWYELIKKYVHDNN